MSNPLSIDDAKRQALLMRDAAQARGEVLSHSKALEQVAKQAGFRDWNSLYASFGNQPPIEFALGDLVRGRYLSQPFEAEIIAIEATRHGWHRITFELFEAVDVVTFDSFSNYRKRISTEIGPEGETQFATSDGQPQMIVRPV